MKKILSNKVILAGVAVVAIILVALLWHSHVTLKEEAMKRTEHMLEKTAMRTTSYLNEVETVTRNMEWQVMNNMCPDSLLAYTHRIVELNPNLNGCSITTEPNYFPKLGHNFSAYTVRQGQTIVTDSVTSSGLAQFIMEWGGEHYRYKRGYRNVIDEAKRLNEAGLNCPLAIETSGHAALRENHFLDDGMYLVTVLICEAMRLKQEGKELTDLIADLREPVESAEIRLDITAEDFRSAGRLAIEKVMDHAAFAPGWHIAPDNREGVRINFDLEGLNDGWFLLRLSVHDPVLPLNIESDVKGGVKRMAEALYAVLDGAEGIDLGKLRDFIEAK